MRLPRLNLIRNKRDILRRPSTAHLLLRPVNAVVLAAGLATGVLLELLAPQPHPAGLAQAQTLWCGDDICSPEIGEEYYNCADCLSSCNWCTDGAFCDAIMPEDEWWFVPGFKGCSTEGCCIHIPPPDGTPPVTTATLDGTAGLNGWYISPVTVTLTATDDQSGVYSTALDGTPYTGPRLYDAEGATTIAYQSYDNRGNLEPLKSTTFYIDTIAPATTVALPPVSGEWHHGEVMLAGTAVDATSGLAGIEVSVDQGKTWLPATGGDVWTYTWNTKAFPDGMVGVLLRGSDQAGNVETPINFAIGVDNSNPFFDVGPFPGEHCFACSGPVTFTLTAFDDQSRIDNTAIVVKQNGKDVRVLKAPNGELRGVPVVWDGRDDQGQPVPPGDYQLLFYTANHAGLFGSFGAGIRVVDALPASPPTTSPVIPVNPPDNPPWIMTPIPPAPVVPASGETTGPAAASTGAPQIAVVPQTNTSNSTSSTTGATGGASTGQTGAVGTGLGALAALAAAYIAARQSMGDKSLGQKLAELAGSWKPAAKPAAPPVPKVAPPKAPPPPPPAPPRPKMLRWDQIAHTPPAPPPPPRPPKPVYLAATPQLKNTLVSIRGYSTTKRLPGNGGVKGGPYRSSKSTPQAFPYRGGALGGAYGASRSTARTSPYRGEALGGTYGGYRSTSSRTQSPISAVWEAVKRAAPVVANTVGHIASWGSWLAGPAAAADAARRIGQVLVPAHSTASRTWSDMYRFTGTLRDRAWLNMVPKTNQVGVNNVSAISNAGIGMRGALVGRTSVPTAIGVLGTFIINTNDYNQGKIDRFHYSASLLVDSLSTVAAAALAGAVAGAVTAGVAGAVGGAVVLPIVGAVPGAVIGGIAGAVVGAIAGVGSSLAFNNLRVVPTASGERISTRDACVNGLADSFKAGVGWLDSVVTP